MGVTAKGDGVSFGVMVYSGTRQRCWLLNIVNIVKNH